MIRIVAVSGSPVKEGNTEALLRESLKVASEDREIAVETYHLSGLKITGCQHCNWCVKKQTPSKFCALSDDMDQLYTAMVGAEVILLATPVHIGRMSGMMADMIDRMRVFVYGSVHQGKLKDKVGGALVIGFLRHGGLEATLNILNATFALFNMISVGRGGLVLSSQDGKGKLIKGVRHMALEDSYGLSTAKGMVERAVELARIIQAGKRALGVM